MKADITDSFQAFIESKELVFQMFDMFPMPVEVFTPDGLSVFVNRALLELNGIPDAGLIVGKYNLLNDPMLKGQYGEIFERAFRGETVFSPFNPPGDALVDCGVIDEKPYETANMDVSFFPILNDGALAYVVAVFLVKAVYQGQPSVARAKEYIESHWLDEHDPKGVSKSVNMSVSQLYHLFKKHTGMTPGEYHKKYKVERIKEKLADAGLTITEAFAACGEDYQGNFRKVFKKITGMSPKEYRESL